jgi:hypothetical protein
MLSLSYVISQLMLSVSYNAITPLMLSLGYGYQSVNVITVGTA